MNVLQAGETNNPRRVNRREKRRFSKTAGRTPMVNGTQTRPMRGGIRL